METTFIQGWALFVETPDTYELIYIRENGSEVAILAEQLNAGSHYGSHARLCIGIYNACYSWDHYNSQGWKHEIVHLVEQYDKHITANGPITEIQLIKNGELKRHLKF
jgi:hypothetical protein